MIAARATAVLCALGVLAGAAPAARAKVLDLYAGGRAGGALGWSGSARGAGVGFEAGAELLGVDGSLSYLYLFESGRLTELLLSVDGDFGLDGAERSTTFLRLGVGGGAAILTRKPPDPALDPREVSRTGVVGQVSFALEQHLGDFVIAGLELLGGFHHLFASRTEASLDGVHFLGLLTLRFHLEPLRR